MLSAQEFELFLTNLPVDMGSESLSMIREHARIVRYKRGEIIVDARTSEHKSMLILSGSCIRFIITPKGKERAVAFHTESFLPMMGSFLIREEHSIINYYIKTNEPTTVMVIDSSILGAAISRDREFVAHSFRRRLAYTSIENQLQNHLMGLDSKSFFHWLMCHYGFLFRRFSSKDIANFMGISPTWLSLLKRESRTRKTT